MIEKIEGFARLPDGKYNFMVVGVPEKIKLESGHVKRIWVLEYTAEGEQRQMKFHLFASDYQPIVLALGGKQVGANVEWDDEKVDGLSFDCELKSVASKDGKYMNYKFENCAEAVPF